MNKKQKLVLRAGIVIIVLMGLFPPVQMRDFFIDQDFPSFTVERQFILTTECTVVLSNHVPQWFMVSIIAGGLIYALKDKKPEDEQK